MTLSRVCCTVGVVLLVSNLCLAKHGKRKPSGGSGSPSSGKKNIYTVDDIDRIEYHIPMDAKFLEGSSSLRVSEFVNWFDTIVEGEQFAGQFEIDLDNMRTYYRDVTELFLEKTGDLAATLAPRQSSIKYRMSFGDSETRYQNDLTWFIALSTPGDDVDYNEIECHSDYSHIYTTKVESDFLINTCNPNAVADFYGDQPVGFSGIIQFDNDEAYGTDDSNAIKLIETAYWGVDPFLEVTCKDMEAFFTDFCSYYDDGSSFEYRLRVSKQYMVDAPIYFFDEERNQIAQGKLSWQVNYETEMAQDEDSPTDAATELTVKLYKSMCSNWEQTVAITEEVVDYFSTVGIAPWIDHSMCESSTQCCNMYTGNVHWAEKCANMRTQNQCEDKGTNGDFCAWIPCEDVGYCIYLRGSDKWVSHCMRQNTRLGCSEGNWGTHCQWVKELPLHYVKRVEKASTVLEGNSQFIKTGQVSLTHMSAPWWLYAVIGSLLAAWLTYRLCGAQLWSKVDERKPLLKNRKDPVKSLYRTPDEYQLLP